MNNGIIIVFGLKDVQILNSINLKLLFDQNLKICLVNNGNYEQVLNLLSNLQLDSKHDISILNLMKEKSLLNAVKAGARFLSSKENVDLIVYTQPNQIISSSFLEKIEMILKENFSYLKKERILLKRIYSFNELSK